MSVTSFHPISCSIPNTIALSPPLLINHCIQVLLNCVLWWTGHHRVSLVPASILALCHSSHRLSPPALAPVCQRSKTGWVSEPIIHLPSPPNSWRIGGLAGLRQIASRQIIQPQPEKEPNKWSLLCRPNGPAFHLARGQCLAWVLHGYKRRLGKWKTHKPHTHLMNKACQLSAYP